MTSTRCLAQKTLLQKTGAGDTQEVFGQDSTRQNLLTVEDLIAFLDVNLNIRIALFRRKFDSKDFITARQFIERGFRVHAPESVDQAERRIILSLGDTIDSGADTSHEIIFGHVLGILGSGKVTNLHVDIIERRVDLTTLNGIDNIVHEIVQISGFPIL